MYEKMIYDLCKEFSKDPKEIGDKFTVIDYYTYISFPQLQSAWEKYEMEKNK